jgi:hypothetical protein
LKIFFEGAFMRLLVYFALVLCGFISSSASADHALGPFHEGDVVMIFEAFYEENVNALGQVIINYGVVGNFQRFTDDLNFSFVPDERDEDGINGWTVGCWVPNAGSPADALMKGLHSLKDPSDRHYDGSLARYIKEIKQRLDPSLTIKEVPSLKLGAHPRITYVVVKKH